MRQVLTLILLLTAFLYASVVIVELADGDARPVFVANVVDGDTVEVSDGRRVRLVGYDAYELSEPLGARARQELRSLCLGEAYLDVDDLEPLDRYGRILGYMWCRRGAGNITWYVSVQKHFIVGDGRRYVKRLLYIPPDEHPYTLWTYSAAYSRRRLTPKRIFPSTLGLSAVYSFTRDPPTLATTAHHRPLNSTSISSPTKSPAPSSASSGLKAKSRPSIGTKL